MLISTKGGYALRVLLDLADAADGEFVPLKDIAERQGLSRKYLERIMALLSKNGLVDGAHGKGGGYRLNRTPEAYHLGEILRLTEGSLNSASCMTELGSKECQQKDLCRTHSVWDKLDRIINNYLDSVSLQDLLKENGSGRKAERIGR